MKKSKRKDRSELIIQLFRECPKKRFSLKQLAACSGGAGRDGRRATLEILGRLLAEGTIEQGARGSYMLARHHHDRYEGICSMITGGAFFVKCEGLDEEIFVGQRNAYNALDGDRVEAVITHRLRDGRIEGEIITVIERSTQPIVGVADVTAHQIFVRPDPRRCPVDIYLPKRQYPDLQDGEKVVVQVVDWALTAKSPIGKVIDRLGMAGENDAEMHAILAEFNLPYRFEPAVDAAAEAISGIITEEEVAARRDMRRVTTFTIDPADAKDFDDALSVRRLKEGVWEVGVHIADVSHYVTPHSVIDEEARARATSVYLVDRTIPMLPERLSNDLCSLRPHEDRLCFSAIFTLNEQLELLDEWFGRTVIHSDRRFTYEEAQQVIERGHGDFADELLTLHRLAQELREERFRQGAMALERNEIRFHLDEQGRPTGVYFKLQQEANQLIEEFMLLANRRVATFCAHQISPKGRKMPRTMVYRVHDKPSEEKIERFRDFSLRFGHLFRATKGRAVAKEMTKLLNQVRGSAEENALSMMAVKTMAKAAYSTDNLGHYGLAFPCYTHFTSPIRRYPDVLVHRLLAHYLAGGRSADKAQLEALCVHSSERELVAADAERASIKYKTAEFMLGREGECFDGFVTGMNVWGLFVELDETHIDGSCYLRDIEWDSFYFDAERYEIHGHFSRMTLRLGDRVRIRVRAVDLERRALRFDLLPTDSQPQD